MVYFHVLHVLSCGIGRLKHRISVLHRTLCMNDSPNSLFLLYVTENVHAKLLCQHSQIKLELKFYGVKQRLHIEQTRFVSLLCLKHFSQSAHHFLLNANALEMLPREVCLRRNDLVRYFGFVFGSSSRVRNFDLNKL